MTRPARSWFARARVRAYSIIIRTIVRLVPALRQTRHDEHGKSQLAGVARMSATQKGHWQSSCNLGEMIRYQPHRLDRSRTHNSAVQTTRNPLHDRRALLDDA